MANRHQPTTRSRTLRLRARETGIERTVSRDEAKTLLAQRRGGKTVWIEVKGER
jgi:hypothetical protein